jgi:hypothetical protein
MAGTIEVVKFNIRIEPIDLARLAPCLLTDAKWQDLLCDAYWDQLSGDGECIKLSMEASVTDVLVNKDPHFHAVNVCSVIRSSAWAG